jgi:hypothetical protein
VYRLLDDPRIMSDAINNQFNVACVEGFIEIFGSLLNDTRTTSESLNSGFEYACQNTRIEIVKILIDNTAITEDNLVNCYIDLVSCDNETNNNEILDILRLKITNK